jgi:FkbM family methyltransferase
LDAGANQGIFSLLVRTYYRCPVLAVEPQNANIEFFRENARLNPWIQPVLELSCAIPKEIAVHLSEETENRLAWMRVSKIQAPRDGQSVSATPLDKILKRHGVSAVGVMKIDVEGYEKEVFEGLDWSSPKTNQWIVMETSGDQIEKNNFLLERGYKRKHSGFSEEFEKEGNWLFEKANFKTK